MQVTPPVNQTGVQSLGQIRRAAPICSCGLLPVTKKSGKYEFVKMRKSVNYGLISGLTSVQTVLPSSTQPPILLTTVLNRKGVFIINAVFIF